MEMIVYKLQCEHCDKWTEFETCDVLGLDSDIDAQVADAYDDAYDDGLAEGRREAGESPPELDPRETDLRLSLYRAIYAGDIEAAEDAMNLMAMVDIDREVIWQAKGMERGA